MEQSLASYLNLHKDALVLMPNNRVKCILSDHEMPPRLNVIVEYMTSAKLKKIKEWYSHDYRKHEPYIVQHKSDAKHLFCTLTKMKLNKIPEEIEKHVAGKKFQRLKLEFEHKKAEKERKLASKGKAKMHDGEDELVIPDAFLENDDDEGSDSKSDSGDDDLEDLLGDEGDYVLQDSDESDDDSDDSDLKFVVRKVSKTSHASVKAPQNVKSAQTPLQKRKGNQSESKPKKVSISNSKTKTSKTPASKKNSIKQDRPPSKKMKV